MSDIDEELTYLEKLGEMLEGNPALKEAYEQIQTIRGLMGYTGSLRKLEDKPTWEQSYFNLLDQADFDESHPQLKEAWDKYYMLKSLIGAKLDD